MEDALDSRVVKAVQSLRKSRAKLCGSAEQPTRTHTPANVLEVLSHSPELQAIRENHALTGERLYEIVQGDSFLLRQLCTGQPLDERLLSRVIQRVEEFRSLQKISEAKAALSLRIQERMRALQQQLSD